MQKYRKDRCVVLARKQMVFLYFYRAQPATECPKDMRAWRIECKIYNYTRSDKTAGAFRVPFVKYTD